MTDLDLTHDAAARSWLASANAEGTDFPLQNLPFGVFRRSGGSEAFRGGVAIGDQVLDLAALAASGLMTGAAAQGVTACSGPVLNPFLELGPATWHAVRLSVFEALSARATTRTQDQVAGLLLPQSAVEHAVPMRIGDYTDFYTSVDHATNIGRLFRPDDPLTPNFKWLPCGYHGRVSSIGVSGQRVRRPRGQFVPAGATQPVFGSCERLDYELELGFIVGTGNAQGEPIPLARAAQHLFGMCLLNDWSARDIQRWETHPLGPFLAKNFATTVSPWIVTMEALQPFRRGWERVAADPQPLPYLDDPRDRSEGVFDIDLEVWLQPEGGESQRLSATSFRHQYWTAGQMVAHHTVGGCNLQPGDLIGSGTISGPTAGEAGALIELSEGGRKPVTLAGGAKRSFLEDGDTVVLRGRCAKPGRAAIGFGECRGTVVPAA
jgi:fumarylacetoacetase